MENTKVSALGALTTIQTGDVIAIVDVSDTTQAASGSTKNITVDNLFNAPMPIGSITPNTGAFTTIKATTGAALGSLVKSDANGNLSYLADVAVGQVLTSGGVGANPAYSSTPSLTSINIMGTTGGFIRKSYEATVSISAAATCTITLNIPTTARITGCQLRVDTALTGGELWDAAYSGGSTAAICTGQAVAKQTKVNSLTTDVTTNTTNIAITKNGGGDFTAAGVIRAIVYTDEFTAMGDAA